MGINIFPTPQQTVNIDSSNNTVKVANASGGITALNPLQVSLNGVIQNVAIQNPSVQATTIKSALNVNTTQTLRTLTNSGNHLVIHSITISNHITSGQTGDRLGMMVGYATTSAGYTQSTTNPTTSTTIASCYDEKGTVTYSFGETGMRLPAGNNLYFFHDFYNGSNCNFAISVVFREVAPL